MPGYDCPTCGGTSSKCYRCDNVVGTDSEGEPIECGADLANKATGSTTSSDPTTG